MLNPLEWKLIFWLIIETGILFGFLGGIKGYWQEIQSLRAEKETLCKLLLSFLKEEASIQVPTKIKANIKN
jgi:hypothetical protein